MATEALIRSKIFYGYGQAAKRLGILYKFYRVATPFNVISPANQFNEGLVSLPDTLSYTSLNKYGSSVSYMIADGRPIADGGLGFDTGDYFANDDFIYFVNSDFTLEPISAVQCNRIIRITRATQGTANGFDPSNPYSGYTLASADTLAEGMPVSILNGSMGRNNHLKLPMDTLNPRFTMLMPNIGDVIYKNQDIVQDEFNQRYVIVNNELTTDLGWRITLEYLSN